MTRAMLLCAGYGTRLGPLGQLRPKPMLPVCDLAILRYGIALLTGHGIVDIVVNLHHRGHMISDEIGDGSAFGARIAYVHEPEILGTGGGIKNAIDVLDPDGRDEPIIVLNGKLIFDLDVAAVLRAFQHAPEALGIMVTRPVADATAWGAVDVEGSGDCPVVRDIRGPRGGYMFCGVHVTRPSVIRQLPDGEACMIGDGYLPWIQNGHKVAAFVVEPGVYFAEHSTPQRYLQSNIDLLRGARLRHPPGPACGIDSSAEVHETACIRPPVRIGPGAVIGKDTVIGPDVVVGSGATAQPGGRIERAVIWPGVAVGGELSDSIATPSGTISPPR